MSLKSITSSSGFQRHSLRHASLSSAIALFELLSTELSHSNPDLLFFCALKKVAADLLRREQAGAAVEVAEWDEVFVRAQELCESIHSVKSLFVSTKGAQPDEQTVSRSNRERG